MVCNWGEAISAFADLISGGKEGLKVVHDFFVFDVGSHQRGVDLLRESTTFLLFQHVPFCKIFLQLLHLLLLQELDTLDIVLQVLQLRSKGLALLLQRHYLVLEALLLRVLAFLPLHQRVHCVLPLYVLQALLGWLDLWSNLVHHLSQLFTLRHLILKETHVFLHSLMPSVAAPELLESLSLIQHLFWSQVHGFYEHSLYLFFVCLHQRSLGSSRIINTGLLYPGLELCCIYLGRKFLSWEVHGLVSDNRPEQVFVFSGGPPGNNGVVVFACLFLDQAHQQSHFVVFLLN